MTHHYDNPAQPHRPEQREPTGGPQEELTAIRDELRILRQAMVGPYKFNELSSSTQGETLPISVPANTSRGLVVLEEPGSLLGAIVSVSSIFTDISVELDGSLVSFSLESAVLGEITTPSFPSFHIVRADPANSIFTAQVSPGDWLGAAFIHSLRVSVRNFAASSTLIHHYAIYVKKYVQFDPGQLRAFLGAR